MKSFKRVLRAALAALVMLGLLVPTALCAGAGAETPADEKCSLTLNFTPAEQAAANVGFSLYRVADVFPEQVKFQALEDYDYHVLEDANSTWAEKAAALKGYIDRDGKMPLVRGTTDDKGAVSFTDLEKGIYLVVGTSTGDMGGKRYTPAPVLLTLPAFSPEANGWVTRDVTANIKSYSSADIEYPPQPSTPRYLAVDVRWEDNDDEAKERPSSVTVQVLRNGKVIQEVKVEQGKDWYYRWRNPWGDLTARIVDDSRDDLITRNYNKDSFDEYDTDKDEDSRTYTFIFTITRLGVEIDPDPTPPLVDPDPDPKDPDDPNPTENDLRVLKVWEDSNNAAGVRPASVTVDLLRDGEVYDTVELSAESNWRHTWTGLDKSKEWQVVEREQENYTVSISTGGVTRVITNTYSPDIDDDKPPLIDLDDPEVPLDPGGPTDPVNPPSDIDDPNIPTIPGDPADPANPQNPSGPETDIPDDLTPLGPMLPQTGILWWPVPVMAVLGAALILLGVARRRRFSR